MSYAIWPDGRTGDVVREVYEERGRQDEKWGEQNHAPPYYLAILAEEFGEASKEVVELGSYTGFTGPESEYAQRIKHLREELIQTAAVAVAFVECLERQHGYLSS